MFYPIFRGKENDIVSTTKVMIEIHVVAKRYYNYSKRIIKKTTIMVHLKNINNIKDNCDINELPEGKFLISI